ncbi:hypothetical protein HG263_21825 [Pseudoalteromonas sp. JBTF-M23]|uniref:SnoaL-like domain-containing protein n=1 Tax=Pseudoalteromonas caenipelagi TaxID=2726988 RepID=A0A849VL39_9GAMM|nr:hypothetical protein [Pseudoalteromonas caenipelagi]NOU53143.1 hypothetical protein [Pseudoalteromonas caenipelagi]
MKSLWKLVYAIGVTLLSTVLHANESKTEIESMTPKQLEQRVKVINALQNAVLLKGSSVADVDALFAQYTDDFQYVHKVYGGTYSRQHLYNNTVKFLKAGEYNYTGPRYTLVAMIVGHDAVSVERQQIFEGKPENHLSVFEFKGQKVSKIIEYWK